MKKNIFVPVLFFCLTALPAQEALKSAEEEYYDFLALQGLTERPALNYRTFSDSVWNIQDDAEHPWQEQNISVFHTLFGDVRMRVYGPELFMSANTLAPYGQNDGVLWQGRGFNAMFKTGVRFEGYGVELTLLPHFAFSQNAPFEIMPSTYENEYGYFWGYAHNVGVDAPQRFGNKPFFDWDFGDSEIRYTWRTLTVGFGTQAIWLGPSYLNSILHTNNAPAYPKFDIGLRRRSVTLPWLDWYIGDIEARFWVGRLAESDYFDDDPSNDYTMFHGFSFAYAPSFLPGLTLFFNWVDLLPWDWKNLKYILPFDQSNTIEDDMKATFGFSWTFPQVGFDVFFEIGMDDYAGFPRTPFHATVFSGGFKKTLVILPEKKLFFEILFEFDWMEMTQDFQLQWPYSYYFHHEIIHGYTNRGQWLGNGVSPGGNSQVLSFTLYYPKGKSSLFIGRNNPDNNYLYAKAVYASAEDGSLNTNYHHHNVANFNVGLDTLYFLNRVFSISGGMVYNQIINPNYKRTNEGGQKNEQRNIYKNNLSFQLSIKCRL